MGKARALGYQIKHRTLRNCVVTVPLPWKPRKFNPHYGIGGRCPTCMVVHSLKTLHLNVADDGTCNVGSGAFASLCRAGAIDGVPDQERSVGMLPAPFEYVGTVEPAPLTIGLQSRGGAVVRDAEGRILYQSGMRAIPLHEERG